MEAPVTVSEWFLQWRPTDLDLSTNDQTFLTLFHYYAADGLPATQAPRHQTRAHQVVLAMHNAVEKANLKAESPAKPKSMYDSIQQVCTSAPGPAELK